MQAQPFRLVRQDLGALPIFDHTIQRIELLQHLTEAMGQVRYAEAILLLLKNILIERNALYAIREWAAPYDPALVYGGRYGDDVLGRSDFLYVADSKLCVSKTLMNIDRNQGRFITIMPRTRAEVEQFRTKVHASLVRWEKVWAKRSSRGQGRIDLYEVAIGLYQMQEGFKIYWFRSSEKARRDWNEREDKVAAAMDQLRMLADPERTNRPKTENALRRKVELILSNVEDWIRVDITLKEVEKFQQLKRGRSSSNHHLP